MSEQKTNPLLAGIVNLIPAIVNTVGSIVKNKKNKDEGSTQLLPALMPDAHNIAKGLELSSKVVVGYGIGGTMISYALSQDLAQRQNLIVMILGSVLVAITTIMKVFEK